MVLTNILWRFAERCGAQLVSFVVSLILARLLSPDDYGVVSLIMILMSILTLFVDSGFKNALVQKKDADQLDFSTVFYFNIGLGISLYCMMYICAPFIASFFNRDYMTSFIRVMSLALVIGGVNGVQTAVVTKTMKFRTFFYSTLSGTIISAVVGIVLAYKGAGVWALIAQRLLNQLINTVVLWYTVKWRPSLEFSVQRLKPMFSYGSKLLGASILNSFTSNLSGILIGKKYNSDMLAYYDKGRIIPNLLTENLLVSVQSVLFPVLAVEQDRRSQVKVILKRSVEVTSYFIFPIMIVFAVCAEPIVVVLYSSKWIEMVPYLRLWCFISLFYLWNAANLQVIQALGRSDIFLKIEVVKQVLGMIGIVCTLPFGVLPMLISVFVTTVISVVVNAIPNTLLAGYGFLKQLKDLSPIICLNIILAIVLWMINKLQLPYILLLCIEFIVAGVVYVSGSIILKLDIYRYIIKFLRDLFNRRGADNL